MLSVQSINDTRPIVTMPPNIKMRHWLRPLIFRLLYPAQIYWNRKPRLARIGRLALRTDPAVFHPGQHFSSKMLAAYVANLHLQGCQVLDMGSGSGIIGITAAQCGAAVVAVDINPAAAKLSARNALEHGVSANMRAMCSDLFTSLDAAPKFDWIIFNPPFFPRAVTVSAEIALNAGNNYEIIRRFLQQAKSFLAPSGKLLVIFSSDMDLAHLQNMIQQFQYRIRRCSIKPHWFESFYLLQLVPTDKSIKCQNN